MRRIARTTLVVLLGAGGLAASHGRAAAALPPGPPAPPPGEAGGVLTDIVGVGGLDRLVQPPQQCGQRPESAEYDPVGVGSAVRVGRHRPVDEATGWAPEMERYVGRSARVTALAGTDPQGCPVVRLDVDGGLWAWRARDLALLPPGEGISTLRGLPQECSSEADAGFGGLEVGVLVTVRRHRAVAGDDAWAPPMDAHAGKETAVAALAGVDAQGCPVVTVEADGGLWFWRVRDLLLGGMSAPTGVPLPQACGGTAGDFGALRIGDVVTLARHRPVAGDTNWAPAMEELVGREAAVTELAGVDPAGCAVVRVDLDGGTWIWRVRDLGLRR